MWPAQGRLHYQHQVVIVPGEKCVIIARTRNSLYFFEKPLQFFSTKYLVFALTMRMVFIQQAAGKRDHISNSCYAAEVGSFHLTANNAAVMHIFNRQSPP